MHPALKLDNEIWKEIPGYPGSFASNLGRIRSARGLRKFYKNPVGYFVLCMSKNGKCRTESVHKLIADAFIPNPLVIKTINHINGIKTDNRVDNLERCTYSGNITHAYRTGLRRAKLNYVSASIIREAKEANFTAIEIARYFKVNDSTVERVVSKKIWS